MYDLLEDPFARFQLISMQSSQDANSDGAQETPNDSADYHCCSADSSGFKQLSRYLIVELMEGFSLEPEIVTVGL